MLPTSFGTFPLPVSVGLLDIFFISSKLSVQSLITMNHETIKKTGPFWD